MQIANNEIRCRKHWICKGDCNQRMGNGAFSNAAEGSPSWHTLGKISWQQGSYVFQKKNIILNLVTWLIGTYPREVIIDVLKGGYKGARFAPYEKIRAI